MSLFKPVYIDRRVPLSPTEFREAADDIDGFLVKKVATDLEGQCCTHGYVRPGSTQIMARSMGKAEHGHFTGSFIYQCKVKVLCFNPSARQVIEARVLKANKAGAYALMMADGRLSEAIRILIPREYHLGNEEFDALEPGRGVRIRLLRFRFQDKDAFIQGVGMYEGLAPAADGPVSKEKQGTHEEQDAAALMPPVAATEPRAPVKFTSGLVSTAMEAGGGANAS